MLKTKFTWVEKQMQGTLADVRDTFSNSSVKGTSMEDVFRDFIRQYLPRRLEVGHGEIIDSRGNKSGQTDVVIVNEDHPYLFKPNSPGLFFIEGVSAVGEVKSILTSIELESTLKNSTLYKNLKLKIGKRTMVMSNKSDIKRYVEHPSPFFLFAYESQLSLKRIEEKVKEYMDDNSLSLFELIDGIFILNKGSIINFGDGKGTYICKTPNGPSIPGWKIIESETVLFDFFGFISINMPKTIRWEPILGYYLFDDKHMINKNIEIQKKIILPTGK